jgi:hypothetical protein
MIERQEQFECEFCGAKFNFRKDAEEHEKNCSAKRGGVGHTNPQGDPRE